MTTTQQSDQRKPIATETIELGERINELKEGLDAVDTGQRIEYEKQLDILTQRQRALLARLDTFPDAAPDALPADIGREAAELKRAVGQITDRLSGDK